MRPDLLPSFFGRFYLAAPACFASGSLLAFSMAPSNIWILLFLSFPVLYICLCYAADRKRAFALGWLFGFGYFLFGLSWIGNALLVEGNPYRWAWPLAVSGLPATLAFFPGFAALFSKMFDLSRLRGFAACVFFMSAAEWLRGHIFTGFPWNLYGYAWADIPQIVQVVSLGSVYFLTFLSLFWGLGTGFSCCTKDRKTALLTLVFCLLSFNLCFSYGHWRLAHVAVEDHPGIRARLVQPNIAQADKWDPEKIAGHFEKLLRLSRNDDPQNRDTTYVIWPETATTGGFLSNPRSMGKIRAMLDSYPGGAVLLTGALIQTPEGGYSNSLLMVDAQGRVSNIYDKHHLVPFGEYIPFQPWIPLKPVVEFEGFQRGKGLQSFEAPGGLHYSPLICYEIIFPGRSTAPPPAPAADFIVNVTNDAWYGQSAGPYQHLTQVLFRAVETGTPVLRVANTGFTALIDPLGHIRYESFLFSDSAQTLPLPKKIPHFFSTKQSHSGS